MIILSAGMPRAGSGWHYNLVHDLMAVTGCDDARDIRAKYHLENILTEVNCNIGVLSLRRLALVTRPALARPRARHYAGPARQTSTPRAGWPLLWIEQRSRSRAHPGRERLTAARG